jgi:hypothetical protein
MAAAGWEQGVDVARGSGAGDRDQREVLERVGEELGDECDRETPGDEGADRELVVGE